MRATLCALEPEGNRCRFPSVRPHGGLLHSQEEFAHVVKRSQKNGAIWPRFVLTLSCLLLPEALDPADAEFARSIHRNA